LYEATVDLSGPAVVEVARLAYPELLIELESTAVK
jgi:hypothetical protein